MRLPQTHTILVEDALRLLRAQATTTPRFNLPFTTAQAESLLEASYRVLVERRLREFTMDSSLQQIITHIAYYLTNPRCKFGLLLCGTVGNGKTTMLHAIRELIFFTNNNGLWDVPYRTVSAPMYDAREIAQISKDFRAFRQLKSLPLLFLDDLGKEPTERIEYGNITTPVVELLEYRYENMLPILVSTNLTPSELGRKYQARIADRFNEMLEIVVFKNNSYRSSTTTSPRQ